MLPIRIGESARVVANRYGRELPQTKPPPPQARRRAYFHPMLDLADLGIRAFYRDDVIDTVRFDAPYTDPVGGIRIGDSDATVVLRHASQRDRWPTDPFIPNGITRMYRLDEKLLVRYDLDATGRVRTIFVFE